MNKQKLQNDKKISLKKTQMIKLKDLGAIKGGKITIIETSLDPIDNNTTISGCMFPEQGSVPPGGGIDRTGPSN